MLRTILLVAAALLALSAVVVAVIAWHAIGPSRVTVVNASGARMTQVWLALPERVADAGPLASGERRNVWFWGSPRQGFLLFDASTDAEPVRGCAGEYLDTDYSHRWYLEFQPKGTFVALDNGEAYPQHVCAKESAQGRASWNWYLATVRALLPSNPALQPTPQSRRG